MAVDKELAILFRYVNASVNLAEAVERDIAAGKEFSSDTVLKLGKFTSAARQMQLILDVIEKNSVKLN